MDSDGAAAPARARAPRLLHRQAPGITSRISSSGLLRNRRLLGRLRSEFRRLRRSGLLALDARRRPYSTAWPFADRADRYVHRVVAADHLVGDINTRRTPEDRSLLEDHCVTVALSQSADDLREIVHNLRRDLLVLRLKLVLRILVVALEVLELLHVLVLQALALIRVHQHALFFHFIFERLDLVLLALQTSLQRRDAALEVSLGPFAGVALIQRPLHVNIGELEFGVRRNCLNLHGKEPTENRTDEQPLPHTARKASC